MNKPLIKEHFKSEQNIESWPFSKYLMKKRKEINTYFKWCSRVCEKELAKSCGSVLLVLNEI